jgi:hypothetical protein
MKTLSLLLSGALLVGGAASMRAVLAPTDEAFTK